MPSRLSTAVVARIEDALLEPDTILGHAYFKQVADTFRVNITTIYRHYKRLKAGLRPQRRTGGPRRIVT